MGWMLGPNRIIAKDVKSCITGATQYHAPLGLSDKGRAIKGLVVYNNCDLEPFDLLSGDLFTCISCYFNLLINIVPALYIRLLTPVIFILEVIN